MNSGTKAIVIAARRTAIGRIGGLHRARRIEDLAAPVLAAVLADAGLAPGEVDEMILGNAAGGGGNPARLIALAAGLPDHVPAITVDRQCASGLDAVITGARLIETGAAHVVVAGGAESPSTAPWRVAKPRSLYAGLPRFFDQAPFAPATFGEAGMAEAAEAVARRYGIDRARQDAYALASHAKAVAADRAGRFDGEIVALAGGAAERRDECPRDTLTAGLLARMPAFFPPDGTVTAGNSCQINDGAALAVLVSARRHEEMGRPPGLLVLDGAAAGVDPGLLGIAAVPAAQRLLARLPGMGLDTIDAVEFNEAFAAQVLASLDLLGVDPAIVNAQGGALAFGHPYGASGAILVTRLFTRMVREGTGPAPRLGLTLLAAAGGLGTAALFAATGR